MVGKHGGHCFLVGADGLGQVLSVRIGLAFSVSPVFQLKKIGRIFQNRLDAASLRTDHC